MAQSPDTAEFDGMPRSAIATGLMDYKLPPGEMPAKLMAYAAHAFSNLVRTTAAPTAGIRDASALQKIFVLLRSFTGHDFSQYKLSTISRRIERRMAVQEIKTLDNYVKYLQQSPVEGDALFRDLLIGVTNFFRDPEAFTALEEQGITKLFEGKPPGSTIRVWSIGCSTGEEAYSLAILLQERMEALGQSHTLQIFATDIDDRAIASARAASYPASIAADITPARLKRFFKLEAGGTTYRIHKSIRNLLIFSEHDLIKDPPFSKIDLVSCRNLLIYLNADLQKRLFPLFHYTMNPDGMLFLGTSETVGGFDDLFTPLARQAKLYRRKENRFTTRQRVIDQLIPVQPLLNVNYPRFADKATPAAKPFMRALAEKAMVQQIVHASALVNEQGDILYIHGRTGRYLELAPGEGGINNILKTAREGLRHDLVVALRKAAQAKQVVVSPGVRVKTNGDFTTINLTVSPVLADPAALTEETLYLVILEEAPQEPEGPEGGGQTVSGRRSGGGGRKADARVEALSKKLLDEQEYLQNSLEDLESSSEELRSANEEIQSANEELETSKEELQSTNEELHTVNAELQNRVVDLVQANNDINNLLVGTGIGTLFMDFHLRVLRFTSPIAEIINVTLGDVGRYVLDFSTCLKNYFTLDEDIRGVLDSLVPVEREVQTTRDKWYLLRILPYRTTENIIEGAILSCVDINELKKANVKITDMQRVEDALRTSEERFKKLFVEAPLGVALVDSFNGRFYDVNPMFAKIAGRTPEEMVHIDWMSITHPDDVQKGLYNMALLNAGKISGFHMEKRYLHRDGTEVWINMAIAPVRVEDKEYPRHLCMIDDITERKRTEDALRKANDLLRLAVVVRDTHDAVTVQDLDDRIIAWNPGAVRMYGWSEAEALKMNVNDRIPHEQREGALDTLAKLSRAKILEPYRTQRLTKDGRAQEVSIISTALLNEAGEMYAIATTERIIAGDTP
jgi:two-component system CheB/CheR fusion protein